MAAAPEWLQWINPAPEDDAEMARIEGEINHLVDMVKWGRSVPDESELATMLWRAEAAAKALHEALESIPTSYLPPMENQILRWDRLTIEILFGLTGMIQSEVGDFDPSKKRRPYKIGKWAAIYAVSNYLETINRRRGLHLRGPVVGLAKWAWEAGGGDITSPSS
jgi:hypothetical protein